MKRRSAEAESTEIDLTPMLDVVFIMLIFFIVTAVFIREPGVDILRPDTETDVEIPRLSVLIAVTENNEVWVDNREVDPNSIRALIERMRADNPQGSVVIQADDESDSGVVIDVIDQARQAGAPNVAVATLRD